MTTYAIKVCACVMVAMGLSACASKGTSGNQRTEHHYAFAKPRPQGVANVVAATSDGQRGPQNTPHSVYFDYDRFVVRESERAVVEQHAQWLRANPQRQLRLSGHTDVRGGIEYNLALGQKRAEAVRKNLQVLGVNTDRVEAVSYGKERLADTGLSEAAHQQNRRVDFSY